MIRRAYVEYDQSKKQWCVRSENNPDWSGGCYDSEGAARQRLKEVEFFKHQGGSMKTTKYALAIARDSRDEVLAAIKKSDPKAQADPEGNPVRMWVTTTLTAGELMGIPGVEDAVESMGQGGSMKTKISERIANINRYLAADEEPETEEREKEEEPEVYRQVHREQLGANKIRRR